MAKLTDVQMHDWLLTVLILSGKESVYDRRKHSALTEVFNRQYGVGKGSHEHYYSLAYRREFIKDSYLSDDTWLITITDEGMEFIEKHGQKRTGGLTDDNK